MDFKEYISAIEFVDSEIALFEQNWAGPKVTSSNQNKINKNKQFAAFIIKDVRNNINNFVEALKKRFVAKYMTTANQDTLGRVSNFYNQLEEYLFGSIEELEHRLVVKLDGDRKVQATNPYGPMPQSPITRDDLDPTLKQNRFM